MRGRVLGMAMYGVAAATAPATALRALRSHIARALDPKAATGRSADLAFESAGRIELDPEVHVTVERVMAARRCWYAQQQCTLHPH